MIEAFIAWLGALPPLTLYATIALFATIENIFPPFPADTAIAIGAFLAHRGITDPFTVFGVTFVANVGGAMGMYFLAARHSESLYSSRLARRLLPEDGLAFVQKEYRRFGTMGLFIGRLLPGFRAVVAPFAGLAHLGPLKAGIPIALASGLWYGTIIFGAVLLGEQLDELLLLLGGINRSLGLVALAVLVVITAWILRRRRGRTGEQL
jgi:membrane protein DedA with SNARE-associated domain